MRKFRDPRGWQCQIERLPEEPAKASLTVRSPNGLRSSEIDLSMAWEDLEALEDIDLWEALDEAPEEDKLAILIQADQAEVIERHMSNRPKYKAVINVSVSNGQTPLYMAVDMELPKVAGVLLEHGADMDRKSLVCTFPPIWRTPKQRLLSLENLHLMEEFIRSDRIPPKDLKHFAGRLDEFPDSKHARELHDLIQEQQQRKSRRTRSSVGGGMTR